MSNIQLSPICPYCKSFSKLVDGTVIYSHRPDLSNLKFWQCAPCDAFVGCHKANVGYGDGTRPLGSLANKQLRGVRSEVHRTFDPLWADKQSSGHRVFHTRREAYQWLAGELQIPFVDCHIACFDLPMARKALNIAATKLMEVEDDEDFDSN